LCQRRVATAAGIPQLALNSNTLSQLVSTVNHQVRQYPSWEEIPTAGQQPTAAQPAKHCFTPRRQTPTDAVVRMSSSNSCKQAATNFAAPISHMASPPGGRHPTASHGERHGQVGSDACVQSTLQNPLMDRVWPKRIVAVQLRARHGAVRVCFQAGLPVPRRGWGSTRCCCGNTVARRWLGSERSDGSSPRRRPEERWPVSCIACARPYAIRVGKTLMALAGLRKVRRGRCGTKGPAGRGWAGWVRKLSMPSGAQYRA